MAGGHFVFCSCSRLRQNSNSLLHSSFLPSTPLRNFFFICLQQGKSIIVKSSLEGLCSRRTVGLTVTRAESPFLFYFVSLTPPLASTQPISGLLPRLSSSILLVQFFFSVACFPRLWSWRGLCMAAWDLLSLCFPTLFCSSSFSCFFRH